MADRMKYKGISLDIPLLEKELDAKIILTSRDGSLGISELKECIVNFKQISTKPSIDLSLIDENYFNSLSSAFPNQDLYKLWVKTRSEIFHIRYYPL